MYITTSNLHKDVMSKMSLREEGLGRERNNLYSRHRLVDGNEVGRLRNHHPRDCENLCVQFVEVCHEV